MLKANNIRTVGWMCSVQDEDVSSSKNIIFMNKICQQWARLDDVLI